MPIYRDSLKRPTPAVALLRRVRNAMLSATLRLPDAEAQLLGTPSGVEDVQPYLARTRVRTATGQTFIVTVEETTH